jgi:NADPH:quinone reductase-like Zn-dependent oxidoreductase
LILFTAEANADDHNTLATLIKEGKLKPRIERTYSYKEIPQAIRYIEEMRTRGKVVMTWKDKEIQ